eukprot:6492786-Amphidinium_carterae.1
MSVNLRCVQYNPQHVGGSRPLHDILRVMRKYSVRALSLTGTGQSRKTASHDGGMDLLQVEACGYLVLQWPHGARKGVAGTNKSCGCMLAVEKRLFPPRSLVQTWTPPARIQGRGGAARFRTRGLLDICFMVVYCPVPSSDPDGQVLSCLLAWLGKVIDALPARCMPVLMMDANCHVGLERVDNSWLLSSGRDCVGVYGAERQSANATGVLELLNTHRMLLVNTFLQSGCGPTYFSSTSSTRVDYIAVPRCMLTRVSNCTVWRRTGHRLQLAESARNLDHAPVAIELDVRLWFDATLQRSVQWDLDGLMCALLTGGEQAQKFLQVIRERAGGPEYRANFDRAVLEHDVNHLWAGLNSIVMDSVTQCFPARPVIRGVVERPQTTELRRAHRAARDALYASRGTADEEACKAFAQDLKHQYSRSRASDFRHMSAQIAEQIRAALDRGDAREAWRQSRRLAGTKVGPKRRRYHAVLTDAPSLSDWIHHMSLEGSEGGMQAVPFAKGDLHTSPVAPDIACSLPMDTHARLAVIAQELGLPQPPERPAQMELEVLREYQDAARTDYMDVVTALRRSKARKSVPAWSAPREAWLLCLQCAGETAFQSDLQKLLWMIRVRRAQPSLWSVSTGCCIPKHNGKSKCKSQRVIHLLDPLGKCHASALWSRRVCTISDHSTGFRSHRRREQSIVQFAIARWHAASQRRGWVAPFYDQANAFGSVSHAALEATVRAALPPDLADILTGRHTRSMCFMQDARGDWALFAIGCGDLQGDAAAPEKFACTFDPLVERWVQNSADDSDKAFFHVVDPCYHVPLDLSFGNFADDVFRIGLANTAATAAAKLRMWDEAMHDSIQVPTRLAQNPAKKQILFRTYGRGAALQARQMHGKAVEFAGEVCLSLLHLGHRHHTEGLFHHELHGRIQAARVGWCSMGRFWSNKRVPLAFKRLVFLSVVHNTLLSGGEVWCLSDNMYQRLDTFLVKHARVLLRGMACRRRLGMDGEWKHSAMTNSEVFLALGIHGTRELLCHRRIRWMHSMFRWPSDHRCMHAALTSAFGDGGAQLNEDGMPTEHSNPWLKQFMADAFRLAQHRPALHEVLTHYGWLGMVANPSLLRNPVEVIQWRPPALGMQPALEDAIEGYACDKCDYVGKSARGLAMHKQRKHDYQVSWRRAAVTNQCPWCLRVFASVHSAQRHLQTRGSLVPPACPTHMGGALSGLSPL